MQVLLETGQLVDRKLLLSSQLYSSLLDSYNDNSKDTGGNKDNSEDSNILRLPVSSSISSATMEDYINFIDPTRRAATIKANLKACSLLDDPTYLEFCVQRLLSNFKDCKDILVSGEITGPHLEDICLLIPKDLWPEQLQDDDKLLSRWINKNFSLDTYPGTAVYMDVCVQFTVDNLIFTYVFIPYMDDCWDNGRHHPNDMYIVSTVTMNRQAKDVYGCLVTLTSSGKFNYCCLRSDCVTDGNDQLELTGAVGYSNGTDLTTVNTTTVGESMVNSQNLPYQVRDLLWDFNKQTRVAELHCRVKWSSTSYNNKQLRSCKICTAYQFWHIKPGVVIHNLSIESEKYDYRGVRSNSIPNSHSFNTDIISSISHFDCIGRQANEVRHIMKDGRLIVEGRSSRGAKIGEVVRTYRLAQDCDSDKITVRHLQDPDFNGQLTFIDKTVNHNNQ